MATKQFRRITCFDNWGDRSYFYTVKYEGDNPHKRFATEKNQDPEQRVKDGDQLEVRWKDGTITKGQANIDIVNDTVADMGHTYNIRTEKLTVNTFVHGQWIAVDACHCHTVRFLGRKGEKCT